MDTTVYGVFVLLLRKAVYVRNSSAIRLIHYTFESILCVQDLGSDTICNFLSHRHLYSSTYYCIPDTHSY